MQERHTLLYETIGYLEEEQIALTRGYGILIGSFAFIVLGTVLEAISFWLYNGKWHPFANILVDPSDVSKCKL